MNINQENVLLEVHDALMKFNCDGINCEQCPFLIDDNGQHCLCLKISKLHTDIMIRRGAWKRDENGHIIKN